MSEFLDSQRKVCHSSFEHRLMTEALLVDRILVYW